MSTPSFFFVRSVAIYARMPNSIPLSSLDGEKRSDIVGPRQAYPCPSSTTPMSALAWQRCLCIGCAIRLIRFTSCGFISLAWLLSFDYCSLVLVICLWSLLICFLFSFSRFACLVVLIWCLLLVCFDVLPCPGTFSVRNQFNEYIFGVKHSFQNLKSWSSIKRWIGINKWTSKKTLTYKESHPSNSVVNQEKINANLTYVTSSKVDGAEERKELDSPYPVQKHLIW